MPRWWEKNYSKDKVKRDKILGSGSCRKGRDLLNYSSNGPTVNECRRCKEPDKTLWGGSSAYEEFLKQPPRVCTWEMKLITVTVITQAHTAPRRQHPTLFHSRCFFLLPLAFLHSLLQLNVKWCLRRKKYSFMYEFMNSELIIAIHR